MDQIKVLTRLLLPQGQSKTMKVSVLQPFGEQTTQEETEKRERKEMIQD